MIADSCSCCGNSPQGCRAAGCMTSMTWCPICDHNKARRRCQSEGLYQEMDPLKELNRCCDKGCDYIHYSLHHSQMKKTDIESEEKKHLCSDTAEMEIGDVCLGNKKHPKPHKDKYLLMERNTQFHQDTASNGISLPSMFENSRKVPVGFYHRNRDFNLDRSNLKYENIRSGYSKYNSIGDSLDIELPGNKSTSYLEQDKHSAEMREKYVREMEILRSKLNLLKGEMACDGKRLRQRSESEPGFPEIAGGVPKRARDNSPKFKYGCRKLPVSPPVNQLCNRTLNKQNIACKESKTEHLQSQACKVSLHSSSVSNVLNEGKSNQDSSESDLEGSVCEEEPPSQEDGDANASEDDDHSVVSSTTSASTDSNTPSQVGETLSSISLNEAPRKEITDGNKPDCQSMSVETQMSVPEHDSERKEKKNVVDTCISTFRVSLFPNVPPYVKFFMHDFKGPALPVDITRHLKWKLSSITPIVIRRTLRNSGFKLVRKSNDWTGQWGKHMKSYVFSTLKDFQKLNHFPGTFQIGRKDRLWKNMFRLMVKFGKKEFGFIPKTYILPQDSKLLRTAWVKASGLGKGQWIVKPPAAARGTGIKVVHKWGQIPKKRPLIVQKYIAKPYLINGSKFDLRLYVLMTSIHPLRIYLYDDGLVRFASVKYSEDVECLSDRFMHLTNYSINKLSTQYCANEDASSCRGHKWTLKALWTYLTKQGVNVQLLRKNLIDLVIKTIISGESNINILSKNNLPSRYCSYELFGIDVLLDYTLKPWLLEVNISPSLHSASPLDLAVKGPLVRELLNIAGFQIPGKLTKEQEENYLETYGLKDRIHSLCYDKRIYSTTLSREERLKHETYHTMARDEYMNSILNELTPDDIRHLIQFEDELTQLSRFEKVFPTPRTHIYHQFFESPRYYNMMFDAWETKYHNNRTEGIKLLESLCEQKLHLVVPFTGGKVKSSPSQSELSNQTLQEGEAEPDSECEGEGESFKSSETRDVGGTETKKTKTRATGRPSVVSKPLARTSFSIERRAKTRLSARPNPDKEGKKEEDDKKEEAPATDCGLRLLSEVQPQQHSSLKQAECNVESMKQYPSCKLENSIINESLNNGRNIMSTPKHIQNTCIKMNTSS